MRISDWSSDVCSSDLAAWNWQGVTGLLLASGAMACWMLPRVMDAAATQAWVDTVKYLSLPLAVGVPLALSWPAAGFVVRGLFVAEAIATCFRLGGLYLAAPVRLCTIYPIGDQQRLGWRSEENTSELQSLMSISYAVCCLKKKNRNKTKQR